MIVQRLRDIQNRFGFLPDAALDALSAETGIPLARIEEVASFFPAFRQERDRRAVLEVRVCRDMTCHHRGAGALLDPAKGLAQLDRDGLISDALRRNGPKWAAEASFPPPDEHLCHVAVEGVSCLGRCDRAPAVCVSVVKCWFSMTKSVVKTRSSFGLGRSTAQSSPMPCIKLTPPGACAKRRIRRMRFVSRMSSLY